MKKTNRTFFRKRTKKTAAFILCLMLSACAFSSFSCTTLKKLITPRATGLRMYEGKWFIIAHLPNKYENDLVCLTTVFKYNTDGTLTVKVSGREKTADGKIKTFTSKAWLPDKDRPDFFRVQVFFTVTQDYRLVYISDDNSCAVLGTPSKRLLWILHRTPLPDEETTASLIEIAKNDGFRTEKLQRIDQVCGE